MYFIISEADLRPSSTECQTLQGQFVDLAVIEIIDKDTDLGFAKEWVQIHVVHDLRKTMDMASVIATLGIVDENQVSTAGTISILKATSKYSNLDGVSIDLLNVKNIKKFSRFL